MSIEIPAVKLSPELVFGMLDIIDRFRDNPKKMREEMIRFYRSKSIREKVPSPKNIVRAVTLPSLRHLDLIEGYWPKVSLNPNGKVVLNAHRKHGKAEAKRKFGVILYRVDEKKGSVIRNLLKLVEKRSTTELLRFTHKLKEKFEVKTEKETRVLHDRLKRWLHYLEYVEFVKQEGEIIKVNRAVLESCVKDKRVKIPTQQFTDLLIRKYKELARKEGSPYVQIPKLRNAVCEETGMLNDGFYDTLRSIKFTTDKYVIMLSEPMLRQKGGINIGSKYYYYIFVRSEKK